MRTYSVDLGESGQHITADYYVTGDNGFVTFKDSNHKQVASYAEDHVVAITEVKHPAPVASETVGTVYVNVAPSIDEAAMSDMIRLAVARAERSARYRKPA